MYGYLQGSCAAELTSHDALELSIANIRWSHHRMRHAILVDKVGHSHHTQHNSSISFSSWCFLYLVYYSSHSICRQLLQSGHSILHQSLGAVGQMQIILSHLQTSKALGFIWRQNHWWLPLEHNAKDEILMLKLGGHVQVWEVQETSYEND